MDEVILTSQEVTDLVDSILDAVEAIEEIGVLRGSWPTEMRDWCLLLLTRRDEGGGATSN